MSKALQNPNSPHSHPTGLIQEPMPLTQALHSILDLGKIVTRQSWEQMMLYLIIQTTCKHAILLFQQWARLACKHIARQVCSWGTECRPDCCEQAEICVCSHPAECIHILHDASVHLNSVEMLNTTLAVVVFGRACFRSPVNQSFQMPDAISLVDTTCAVTKSFSVLYTSIPLWL